MRAAPLAALTLAGLLTAAPPSLATLPEPPNVIHGVVTLNGFPLTHGTVTLLLNGQSEPVAFCAIGFQPQEPSGYALVVPVDALDPRAPGTARPGDQASVRVDGAWAADVQIGARGSVQAVDLALSAPHAVAFTRLPSGLPNPVVSGGSVVLSAEAFDNLGHSLAYHWTAQCPGLGGGSYDNADLQAPSWTAPPNSSGARVACTVTVGVGDGLGLSAQASFLLSVDPTVAPPPVALFSVDPDPAACNQPVAFDGSSSHHTRPDRSVVLWEWDFDRDGSTFAADATGPMVFHVYAGAAGPVTAALRVTDNSHPPVSAVYSATVRPGGVNRPPVAEAGGPYGVSSGGSLRLDGGASSDPDSPCGDSIATWRWDLDGDNDFDDAAGTVVSLDWVGIESRICGGRCAGGQRTVRLRVSDAHGLTSEDASTLTLALGGPVASLAAVPNPSFCGEPVSFDGTGSYHPDATRRIILWEWDFDYDGVTFSADASGATASRTYARMGTWIAALRVTDDAQPPASTIATLPIVVSVANHPPSAAAGGPYSLAGGDALVLDGSFSSDTDAGCGDAIASWRWDLDGDGVFDDASGAVVALGWAEVETLVCGGACDEGRNYPVSLEVTDSLGASAWAGTGLSVTYLLFADDFSDGTPTEGDPDWKVVSGNWKVAGTTDRYYKSSLTKVNRAVLADPPGGGPAAGRLDARVKLTRRFATSPNVALIFAFQDLKHYRYVRFVGGPARKVIIGQVGTLGGELAGKKAARRVVSIPLRKWHQVRIDLHPDGLVEAFFGGATSLAASYRFGTAAPGNIGCQASRCVSQVDDVTLRHESVLPLSAFSLAPRQGGEGWDEGEVRR